MSKKNITAKDLEKILQSFSIAICQRFTNILRDNNQLILGYCDQCIESMTILQVKENTMLETLNRAFQGLESDFREDLTQVLTEKTKKKSRAALAKLVSIKK